MGLGGKLDEYINALNCFKGGERLKVVITEEMITRRVLLIAVPRGSMTPLQKAAFDAAVTRAGAKGIILRIVEIQ